MPPFLRRRFRGWDWFTPRAIQHLPWGERERLIREAWQSVRLHPRYWLMVQLLPWLGLLAISFVSLSSLFLNTSSAVHAIITVVFCAQLATTILWQRRRLREALRQKLLDANLRPAICFECGHDLEGYQGNNCPGCDAPLLRQANSPTDRKPELYP